MLKIRLSRVGKRNNAAFRIVVTEHYKPVKAGFIEHIGFYNPQSKQFQIDKDKLELWIKKGATTSDTVNNLLVREKIFAKEKVIKVTIAPKKKEDEEKSTKGGSASGGKTEAKSETTEKTEKKEETKAKTKEESVSSAPSPDKPKVKDKKLKEKETKEKIEQKKPDIDKK